MGKKRGTELVDTGLLSERLENQRQTELVRSARYKISQNQQPTQTELRALRKFEHRQLYEFGQKYITAMPKGHYLDLFLGSSKVYIEWRQAYGFPWPESSKTVDVREVMRFYRARFAENGGLQIGGEDALLAGAPQQLKGELIRQRIREKEVSNQLKEIELRRMLENWLPIEPIKQWHNMLAELILKTRERIVRSLDGDQKETAEQAFDDLGDDMQKLTDEQFGEMDYDDSGNGN